MRIPLYIVDAFAERPLTGNPAAICLLESWPEDRLMQAIAAEMNLSETGFVAPEGRDWRIRWFTPTVEVDLVGHATLGAAHVLFERVTPDACAINFESLGGPLRVMREESLLMMDFPARVPVPCTSPGMLGEALGRAPREVLAAQHYLAVYDDEAEVRALVPDMAGLAALDRAAVIVSTMTVTGSIGLLAPAGTSIEIIEQIAQATRTAVAEPAYKQMLIDAGIEPTLDSNPEKFRRSLAADVALWTPVVKALALKID